MAKLDMKQAAINHVEKAIFGIVMVVVLLGLIGTKWSPYQGTPGEITQKTRTGENNLIQHSWPEEEKENFPMVKTDNLVDLALYASIDPRPLESSIVPVVDPIGRDEPVTEPTLKTPEDLIASSSVVFLHVAGPADDEETEDSESESDGKDETSEDGEDIDDELRVRANTPGLAGGSGTEAFAGGGYGGGGFGSALGLSLPPNGGVDMTAPEMTELTLGGGYGGSGGLLGEGGVGNVARPRLNGQGYSFVAVRAVFPLREQISKFVDATHQSYNQAASKFEISDFELQRRTVRKGAEQRPAGEEGWEAVDINVAGDVLESAASFEADVVSSVVTNSVMTMPLPERISGVWKTQASHPRIKNFELTDEQIQLEMEINDGMLQEAVKTNRKERRTEVKRKGFSQFQFDTRDVQGSLLGNSNVFAGGMGGESGGSYGDVGGSMLGAEPAGFGGSGRRPGSRGRQATGTGNTALDQLIENLAKRDGEENPKEREKLIREWIMSRISVDGELLLFRYFDFSVEPGKTYEYRVRLTLQNPNFGKRIADAGGLAHVVAGKTRTTDWSNVTSPVKVKETTQYFLARLDRARGNSRLLPSAQMNVYHWDSKYGTMVNKAFEVQLGQPIAGEVETEVIDAAGQEVKEMDYTFEEESFLVDAIEDISIDRSFHANDRIDPALHLNLMRGHRDHFRNEGQVLVKEDEGELVEHGENGNSKDLSRAKKYMQFQKDKTYKHLFDAETALTDAEGFGEYGDLLGAGGFDAEGGAAGMGMLGGSGGQTRKRNSNRKRGRAGSGSSGGSSSGSF